MSFGSSPPGEVDNQQLALHHLFKLLCWFPFALFPLCLRAVSGSSVLCHKYIDPEVCKALADQMAQSSYITGKCMSLRAVLGQPKVPSKCWANEDGIWSLPANQDQTPRPNLFSSSILSADGRDFAFIKFY